MSDKPYTTEKIRVGDLHVDPQIQRTFLDVRRVERMVMNFDEGLLHVITVSRRNAVTQVLIDGMHRQEAARRAKGEDYELEAHVYEGLTLQEEAEKFLGLNSGRIPNLYDQFRVRIVAGDPAAVAISKLIGSYGWTVGSQNQRGTLKAVGTLDDLYLQGERTETTLLQFVIMTITRAWGIDPEGVRATILNALAAVFTEYGDALDQDRLVSILKNYPGGPSGLWADGKQFSATRRMGSVPMGIAERIVDEYNKGLRGRAIHTWRRHR